MLHKSIIGMVTLLTVVVLAAGCATTAKAPGDKAQIAEMLQQWKAAFVKNDISQIMTFYADDFMSKGRDKAAAVPFLREIMQDGVKNDIRVVVEYATITVNGDTATVLPIALSRREGSNTMQLDLAKKGGRWLIVGMAAKGW